MTGAAFLISTDQALILAVNVLLQITLIASVALLISPFVRRNPAFRHWVLCSSLLLMLLSPFVSLMMQVTGQGLVTVSLYEETQQAANDTIETEAAGHKNTDASKSPTSNQPYPSTGGDQPNLLVQPPVEASSLAESEDGAGTTIALADSADVKNAESMTAAPTATVPFDARRYASRILSRWGPLALGIWSIGAVFLLTRLAIGWYRLQVLLRGAQENSCDSLSVMLAETSHRVGLRFAPRLAISDRTSSPFAAGLWTPCVVLPRDFLKGSTESQLRSVLIHEVAHIHRHDQLVILLQHLASALFWLHPLARELNQQLAQAREEVCDNYVLTRTEAPSYSRTLLKLAEQMQVSRPLPGAVGFFCSRWKLENRIAGLFDERRDRMTRTSPRQRTLVSALTVAMILVAACSTMTLAIPAADVGNDVIPVVDDSTTEGPTEKAAQGAKANKANDDAEVKGRVVGPDGTPVAGAFVAVVALNTTTREGGDLTPRGEVLGEATSDADGQFEMQLSGVSSKSHIRPQLIARAGNLGIAWRAVDLDTAKTKAELAMQPEQLIEARLVDIEGRPAAGLQINLNGIMVANPDGPPSEGLGFYGVEKPPKAWLGALITDDEGRFTVRNVAAGQGVFLRIPPTEHFAPQEIMLNSGMAEQRGERDGTYRSIVRNLKPGEVGTIPIAPAQFFEGTLRFADTGEPASNARLTIWASQQEFGGSMASVEGKTDEQGHFRLNPKPGVRFGIIAYPPKGTPYQVRRLNDLRWKSGESSKSIDIELTRGISARGRIVEAGTNRPVHGASIQYIPDRVHNKFLTDDTVTGWQSIQTTGEDGSFDITVCPGPGTLLVHGTQDKFIMKQTESQKLQAGSSGGRRTYAHAIHSIEPEPGTEFQPLTIKLEPSETIEGTITDAAGEAITKAVVVSRLIISPTSPEWRGSPREALNGRFSIGGLAEGEACAAYFLDPKQRLGAMAMLSNDNPNPKVVLHPCGQAKARFVDPDGKPVVGFHPGLHMIVTPGKSRYDFPAYRAGEVVADEDFVANVDRTNHLPAPVTDEKGEVTFPALIPGARYRFTSFVKGEPQISDEFVAESGKTFDMGNIEVQLNE